VARNLVTGDPRGRVHGPPSNRRARRVQRDLHLPPRQRSNRRERRDRRTPAYSQMSRCHCTLRSLAIGVLKDVRPAADRPELVADREGRLSLHDLFTTSSLLWLILAWMQTDEAASAPTTSGRASDPIGPRPDRPDRVPSWRAGHPPRVQASASFALDRGYSAAMALRTLRRPARHAGYTAATMPNSAEMTTTATTPT
jgi:hypothetical protein